MGGVLLRGEWFFCGVRVRSHHIGLVQGLNHALPRALAAISTNVDGEIGSFHLRHDLQTLHDIQRIEETDNNNDDTHGHFRRNNNRWASTNRTVRMANRTPMAANLSRVRSSFGEART